MDTPEKFGPVFDIGTGASRFLLQERYTSEISVRSKTTPWWRDPDARWLVVKLVSISVVGVLLGMVPDIDEWWSAPVHGLGEALIVGAVVAGTIEIYSKRRFLHEIASDVFVNIFGYTLPSELRSRIDEMVRIDLVRRDFQINYLLSDNGDGRVILGTSYQYVLENLSAKRVKYHPKMAFEKHYRLTVREFRCDSEDDISASFCLDAQGKESGEELIVQGPDMDIKPGYVYRFIASFTVEFPDEYSDIFSFFHPTTGVVVLIEHPDDFVFSVAPSEGRAETPKRYSYSRAFLPGEHIRIRWRKGPRLTRAVPTDPKRDR